MPPAVQWGPADSGMTLMRVSLPSAPFAEQAVPAKPMAASAAARPLFAHIVCFSIVGSLSK